MNVVYNDLLLAEEELKTEYNNRAFTYGDGLFETIISNKGKIQYFDDHVDRLHRGMNIFKMTISESLSKNSLAKSIKQLLEAEDLPDLARIKIIVWRKTGGFFAPTESNVNYLITAAESKTKIEKTRNVDFCVSVNLHETIFSEFKCCSSLNYVLAGIELKERNLDDIILLDEGGNVGECLYSNIFWVKDNEYFTPSLDTGCIAGIRRKNIIETLKSRSIKINVLRARSEELLAANYIFTSNVAGLYPITKIGKKEFPYFIPDL